MPIELTIVAITALVAGLLLILIMLSGRSQSADRPRGAARIADFSTALSAPSTAALTGSSRGSSTAGEREPKAAEGTLRVVWWLTVSIVLLGVGISNSFGQDNAPIFVLGAAAVVAIVIFHELSGVTHTRLLRLAELVASVALIAGLLALTGFASSPFAMLFALVSVAAALSYGPRAGILAVALALVSFGAVLYADPELMGYGPSDALRLSVGLVATCMLAFVAIAYASHQRRAIASVLALSRTDALTALSNRSQLFVTLEQEVSRTRRSDRGFCVLMIDLDGLKSINDSMGHLWGDEVLRALGTVIRQSIRTVDSAYRYGGDEFVVLLPETDIVGAFVVAEKVRAGAEDLSLSLTATLGGADAVTSVSIGLVSHPEDGFSAEELMTAADRAMYQAKSLGKNQISGNPRARPALIARRTGGDLARGRVEVPVPPSRGAQTAPREDRAVAVELGPIVVSAVSEPVVIPESVPVGEPPAAPEAPEAAPSDIEVRARTDALAVARAEAAQEPEEEDQADAGEVRRQIAVASRSFDPDHQIRRAMDAFLSPITPEAERRTPDH